MAVRKPKNPPKAAKPTVAAPEPVVEPDGPVRLPITRSARTEPCPRCGQAAFLDDGGDGELCSGCGKRS